MEGQLKRQLKAMKDILRIAQHAIRSSAESEKTKTELSTVMEEVLSSLSAALATKAALEIAIRKEHDVKVRERIQARVMVELDDIIKVLS